MSLPIRTLTLSYQGPILITSFNLNYFLRGPVSKYSHIGGLEFQSMNLWAGGNTNISSTIIVGDFNIPLSIMNIATMDRQIINKEIQDLTLYTN